MATTDQQQEAVARALDSVTPMSDASTDYWDGYTAARAAALSALAPVQPDPGEAWDEGFEAGSAWVPQTNGIPHDPPHNPYHSDAPVRPDREALLTLAQDMSDAAEANGSKADLRNFLRRASTYLRGRVTHPLLDMPEVEQLRETNRILAWELSQARSKSDPLRAGVEAWLALHDRDGLMPEYDDLRRALLVETEAQA